MNLMDRLYKKGNYTIQKSLNLEDKLYTRLKEIVDNNYDATFSDAVNICVEKLIAKGEVSYYAKPKGEIVIYRSIMMRKNNMEALCKLNSKTGISVTRLINIAIKEFLDEYDKG